MCLGVFCIHERLTSGSIQAQSRCIAKQLIAADVRHLDVYQRNIAFGADGSIGLIDFDIAVVQGQGVLKERYCLLQDHDIQHGTCSMERYEELKKHFLKKIFDVDF